MSDLVAKVETFLLKESLDAICSATVIYHTMNRNNLPSYEYVRGIVEQGVESSLAKLTRIEDFERKSKVLDILPEVRNNKWIYIYCRTN